MYDKWVKVEPPKGEGYQLWETTSEGSPKSPVFKNIEDLAEWLTSNKISIFGENNIVSKEEWIERIKNNNFSYVIGKKDNNVMIAI